MSKKTLLLIAALTVAGLFFATFFSHKGKSNETFKVDPAFSGYVSAFTSGMISNHSVIHIVLANEVTTPIEVDKPVTEELFDFSPGIKGVTTWLDKRTIEFKPITNLPSGQHYRAQFFLSKVMTVPNDLKTFDFDFETIKQSFDVYVDGVKTTDKQTLRWQRILGTVSTSDVADAESVGKILIATQNGKTLKLSWEHETNQTKHHFSIDSVMRSEKAAEVILSWNGSQIGVDTKGERKIPIPALGDFDVWDVKVFQSPQQYVSIQLSDPVLEKQNLDGLININGMEGAKYIIEDNEIKVYPPQRLVGPKTINVETGVKNVLGINLRKRYSMEVMFEELKPMVKLMGKGVILPNSKGLNFPFMAVSLKAIDVKIIRIFENNIPQFLQVNNLEGSNELKRVGRTILKKTVQLNSKTNTDLGRWNNYSLDLSTLIKAEPGAIYKVVLSFKKAYSTYHCDGVSDDTNLIQETESTNDDDDDNWDYYGNGGYYNEYNNYYEGGEEGGDEGGYNSNYQERESPCKSSYYRGKEVSTNILASDIGMIAKRGENGQMLIVVTDLLTTKPLSGVDIEIFDYQQQRLNTLKTNGDGICTVELKKKPFLLIAKSGSQRGYLKMDDGSSLSLSMFDVSGESVQKGIKGFIYGERGVWRPGDTLFLSFILEDKEHSLPKGHPVTMEIINPLGKLTKKIVQTNNVDGFYNFTSNTDQDAPTGNWTVRVKVGGATFTKMLKIETVMPNRLKINLDFGGEKVTSVKKEMTATLSSKWLTGATARNLRATVEASMSQMRTEFKNYEGFNFDDPARTFYSEPQTIFDGNLNDQGNASVKLNLNSTNAPGMLRASFNLRVFEEGGNFSIDRTSVLFHPYSTYVGIKTPDGNGFGKTLVTDTTHIIKLATVDADGKPVSKNKLKVQIYKVSWRWWWERYDNELASYVGNNYNQPFQTFYASTVNGIGEFPFKVNRPEWGRFLIHVTDEESGHATGQAVYIDWPSGAGSAPKGNEGASMLSFTADKVKYNVGESVKLTIPSSEGGRVLISLENGSHVLKTFWAETKKGETTYNFPVTSEMTPNIYVNVTLLQPHAQTVNDLPIRMYGVIPIQVEDPNTFLKPVLKTPDVWKPEEKCSIGVSEENGKEMTYTIAVVDDGLLDLTHFKTPDPWNSFYAREALGVKSWDLYDMVMGAFSGELQRILAIGGDGDMNRKGGNKANRFKPMVKYFGPFHLGKGQKQQHDFMMPQYVGSVRVMLIAGYSDAYGFTDKTVSVRKPLMLLGTLPRVVGPGETVDLPVTVFAMEKNVKNVSVDVTTNEFFTFEDGNHKNLTFTQTGDEVVNFRLKVKAALGIGKVKIIAGSGSEKATYDIEIDVRNPNPKVTNVVESILEPGKVWNYNYTPVGIAGTNKGTLELSSIPPINLENRLRYLVEYPHGCVEQTTSAVFPQLFLGDVMELNSNFKIEIDKHIKAGIDRLRAFQTTGGGLAYWPGYSEPDDWGSSYAGHFMLEAELKGYAIPVNFLENWKRYQKQKAQAWQPMVKGYYYYYHNNDLAQAYRLYTLVLAKAPELGAMNRLKEYAELSTQARWRLAAAYARAGQTEAAKSLIANLPVVVNKYTELSYTYGCEERDEAMILETLVLLGEKTKAALVLKNLSAALSANQWMSTQATAYSLIAVSKFVSSIGSTSDEMRYAYTLNAGGSQSLNTKLPVKQIDIGMKGAATNGSMSVTNTGKGIMFARLILEGIPETGDKTVAENDLKMTVNYKKMSGENLEVDKLTQGTDFIAEVSITNPGTRGTYSQMALTQIFPSGWEIHNSRMDETESKVKSSYPTYQDIRDDRVYTYFDIDAGTTKVFRFVMNAAYTGKYYLPTVSCEAMYDNTISGRRPGKWVEVVKAGGGL